MRLENEQEKGRMVSIKQLDQGKKEQLAHPTKEFDAKLNKSRQEMEEVRNKINEVSRTRKNLDSKSKEVLTLSNDEKLRLDDISSKLREKLKRAAFEESLKNKESTSSVDSLWCKMRDDPNQMGDLIC